MKEFNAQTGGRYTYVDDIVNLQELALAFASVFDDCDNFIISGCEVSDTTISSGYVYINGKIRYFPGVSGVLTWPQYLYESNRTETVAYASGDDKVGRNVYECAVASAVPTRLDPLTGKVPAFIKFTAQGGRKMREAFFGKYALLLQSAMGTQVVSDAVTFEKSVNVNGVLKTGNSVLLEKNNAICKVFYSENKLVIQSQVAEKTMCIAIDNSDGFQFSVDNTPLCTIGTDGIVFNEPVTTTQIISGNICVTDNDIFNKKHADNDACININMTGYNNGNSYYRNTIIGDGKNNAIITVTGSTKNVQITGNLSIDSTATASLSLRQNKCIQWLNGEDNQSAYIGYNSSSGVFDIKNTIGSIVISATNFVNITAAIMERGELLTDKYVTRAFLTTELNKKASATEVYTRTMCDTKFLTINNGLIPLTNVFEKDALCGQIGAATKTYVNQTFVTKNNLLSDIATNEEIKKQICDNIGAAYGSEYQVKLNDTGWLLTDVSLYYSSNKLYVRQIGNIVYIQGKAAVSEDKERWYIRLPVAIAPPTHAVSFTYRKSATEYWTGWIEANSRLVYTANANNITGEVIPITITYMV